jgi:UDP-glucose 4-epimerase
MRKATLIGGNGYVGRHLLARLLRDGWACWVPQRDDLKLMHRDLGHVFYCAGLTADYAERPFDTVEAHTSLLNQVLRDTTYTSLVYLSSTRLYDSLGNSLSNTAVDENSPLTLNPNNPRHVYDLSKALGESLCRVASNGRARVARLSCVWGGDHGSEGFLPELMRGVLAACKKQGESARLRVNSSPHFKRDYVHVDDVIDALIALAAPADFGIYNVAGGRNISNTELFKCVLDASGCTVETTSERTAPALPRISIERMAQNFGWTPTDALQRLSMQFKSDLAHT